MGHSTVWLGNVRRYKCYLCVGLLCGDGVNDMRLIEIITIRKNKFNEHRKNPSFTDFWKVYHEGWYNAYKDLEEILEQKGFDAVPVVRCRECKHFVQGYPDDPCECMKWTVKWGVAYAEPDDFCSYGERKDGEG